MPLQFSWLYWLTLTLRFERSGSGAPRTSWSRNVQLGHWLAPLDPLARSLLAASSSAVFLAGGQLRCQLCLLFATFSLVASSFVSLLLVAALFAIPCFRSLFVLSICIAPIACYLEDFSDSLVEMPLQCVYILSYPIAT